ncbi:ABC-2 type transport system permease protein [Paenibacillus endophyticus]|uniref:ABC-2 type transport system permease protein n=1 Tax=Paenibacillus endophyticus TaxID=1294268 RepID=A0A7W5GCG6_9BACL|nr:ABC transporter permease [Paenibacillus endophyticus]MBB3154795.1 ABC-2 type transport system permease protein [Paenibacillus endophyticus]
MHNFGGLITNEWLKMSKKRSFFIGYAVMLVTVIGFAFLIKQLSSEELPSMLDFTASIMTTNGVGQIVTIIAVIFTAGIVAKEHQLGTIKFLLIRAHGRSKILASKYVAAILFAVSLIIFTIAAALASSGALFGFATASGDGTWLLVAKGILFQTVYTLIYVSLTFMFGILTRSTGATIGIGMTAVLLEGLIQMLLSRYEFSKYLLFMNMDLSLFAGENSTINDLVFPSAISAIYVCLFIAVSFVSFKKRDIA